ncbi:MAG: radical SAM protein [Chlamydiota bacterium]
MPILKDLHLRMTSKCNFNCKHCYAADWFSENHALDLKATRSLVDQAIELGCKKVTFTGGEPLVTKFTVPTMKYCTKKGLRVELESNGVLIDRMIDDCKDYLDKIEFAISYEGDDQREAKYSPKVLENIRLLVSLGCDVKLQTVITTINIKVADSIFELSKELGTKHRAFLSHSPNGNATHLSLMALDQWLTFLQYVRKTYPHVIVELPDLFSGGAHKKCGWGVHRCEIMPNGDVTSCGPITFNHRHFIAGNIYKQPLEEIWNSPHFSAIRNLKQKDFDTLCGKCPYWTTCLGACRSISYASEGKLLSPHPFCASFYRALKDNTLKPELVATVARAKEWFEAVDLENPALAKGTWQKYNELMNTPIFDQNIEWKS